MIYDKKYMSNFCSFKEIGPWRFLDYTSGIDIYP